MKARVLVALASILLGGPAVAQSEPGSIPTQQFAPAPGGDNNYVTTQGSGVLPSLMPAVGLYINYANQPLVLTRVGTDDEAAILEHQVQLDLIAALGLFDVLEIGLAIPMTLWQAEGDFAGTSLDGVPRNSVDAFTTGDIRLYPKWSILHDPEGFGLALLAAVSLPTGNPESLQGNESVTIEPRLVAQLALSESFRFSLSGGFNWRPEEQSLYNINVGNEVTFGAGVEYVFTEADLGIILEGYGKVSIESDATAESNPIEVALAARWWPAQFHALTLGVARGLTDGYGAPNFRVFLGYNFTPRGVGDRDGDGIPDDVDRCPDRPEDFDGYQDQDGCPDLDNDSDGIPDVEDECPNDPEDFDGFEDEDGCPDPDNDGDGILDVDDQCPNEPGPPPTGCPNPDTDGDGICDPWVSEKGELDKYAHICTGVDQCPNEPEDRDGFEDEDGCPDPDNDGDGVLDVDDPCPDDPEDTCNIRMDRCEIRILQQVFFAYDRAVIKEESYDILNEVAEALNRHDWIERIEVQGHTDSDGTAAYNLDLSQRRAQAVVDYLVEREVERGRIVAQGYGLQKPIADNTTAAGRAQNRRVQFIILEPSLEECEDR